jgi:hypothetical protein
MFFNNGQLLTDGSDYGITGTTLEFSTLYPAPTPTDVLKIFFGLSSIASQSGISGLQGISGISGVSGYSGSDGVSGISGLQGSSGISGVSGYSGSDGVSGISGLQGSSGISGVSGYSGSDGVSGISGLSGISGMSGITSSEIAPNLVTVSLPGGVADFNSVKLAVDSITAATATSPYVVYIHPGTYYENSFSLKSYITIRGESSTSTIIEAIDPNSTLIYGADQSMIQDVQIQGCTGTGVSAIVYSSSTTPQLNAIFYVENVRFGTNYTHVKNIGTGGGNSIIQCSNVKYGGYPFTLGFYCTNDGSGIGRMQLRNVTSTNGGITTTSNLVFAKADKSGCGFIVNGCLLTKAVGAAAGTGFWVEDGGFLRLTGVNFQRWATGIYAPQVGSAPSIDAIALNFENCTTDVNIVHSGATGKVQGTDNFIKTLIPIDAPLYEVGQDPRRIVVAKKGGDFTSIKSAVDYITGSSSTNRFVVEVGPGKFSEDEIDLVNKPYVSIVGSNIQTTEIVPNSSSQHIFKLGINNEISFLTISGSGSGYAAIYVDDIGDFAQAHKISIYDCDIGIWVKSSTQDTKFYGEYIDINGYFSYGVRIEASNSFLALANMENYYLFPTYDDVIGNSVDGLGGRLNIYTAEFEGALLTGSTAIIVSDEAECEAGNLDIQEWDKAIVIPNIGNGPSVRIVGTMIHDSITYDMEISNSLASLRFQGVSDHSKIYNVSNDVYWNFLDDNDGENDVTRKLSVTFADGTHTDASTLIFQGSAMGSMTGGTITFVSGLTISTAAGFGYLQNTITSDIIQRIDWSDTQLVLAANSDNYIFITDGGTLSASGGLPSPVNNIVLGRVVTNSTTIEFIEQSAYDANHTGTLLSSFNRNGLGSIYAEGSIVTQNTTPFQIDITQGSYYFSENNYIPTGGTGVTFTQYYYSGSGWITSATTYVNNYQYNAGQTSLSALTTSAYTKHTLYTVGDGVDEKYFLVLGQNEYTTLVEAEDANLPTPPTFFKDAVTPIASIYIQQGFSGITQIEDIRPIIGFKAAGVNATAVHGNLLGLGADDHTQYLLVDGTRQMSGDLGLGGNDIYNTNTITTNYVTTTGLTISNLTQDNAQTKFVVVDNAGVTYYRTGGESGISGLQGPSGISGLQGLSGISGIEGLSGISGIQGINGDSGISGISGLQGISGVSGLQGISGMSGISPTNISTISFTVDTGGAAPISSGLKSFVYLPYSGEILSWTILTNTSGSTELDLYKSTYANYPPDISDTIITTDYPYLSNMIKNQSSNLTGWTTTFDADDIIGLYVKSASTITRIQLILEIQK